MYIYCLIVNTIYIFYYDMIYRLRADMLLGRKKKKRVYQYWYCYVHAHKRKRKRKRVQKKKKKI